jgi:epoxyqueuosine reductase
VLLDIKVAIITQARALGFDHVGVAKADALPSHPLDDWLDKGYHADMSYMANHRDMRLDPRIMLPGARSVIVVALNYYTPFEPAASPDQARISRYAWGDDYHNIITKRLKKLLACLCDLEPAASGRLCVDSAPVLEKAWAMRAGIGWMGKHSCIISPQLGSWIFLGEIITNLELEPDTPIKNRCGTCRLCIDACPTGAIVAPHMIDSRRCLSYLTIEHKGELSAQWQAALGNHICGCDICQEVCPWNRQKATATTVRSFYPRLIWQNARLANLATWSELEFQNYVQQSPVKRMRFEGFKRNIAVGLKNCDQRM